MNLENEIINTSNIMDVYEHCKCLLDNNINVLLFLDIDDTVLSSKHGEKFLDKNITKLVNIVYQYNPNNLFFLTARDYEYKKKTINQLNGAKLVHDNKYIHYNVIHSPYNYENAMPIATKGNTLTKFIIRFQQPSWIIFVDDAVEQIESVYNSLNNEPMSHFNYTLYHYITK